MNLSTDLNTILFYHKSILIYQVINNNLIPDTKFILLPSSSEKRGNPVLFSSHFKSDILTLENNNGCKPLVITNQDCVIEIPFTSNHCHTDIDTMEDYKRIKY